MNPSAKRLAPAPQLKLFSGPASSSALPGQELTSALTVRQFFDLWMLPIVLEQQRETGESTRGLYLDAISWWEVTTGDPPLGEIDEWVWSKFCSNLRRAEFKRGPASPSRVMALATQAKHQRALRAILGRAEKRHLLLPFEITVRKVNTEVKPDFSLEQARQIVAWLRLGSAASRKQVQQLGQPADWWVALVAMGFYTGLRSGELLAVTWQMLENRPAGEGLTAHWLVIPGSAIAKTGKGTVKAVHACLLEALEQLRESTQPKGDLAEKILRWPHDPRHLATCHARLQRLAGIPEEKVLSPHAWRRTFATQLALTGLAQSQALAQGGLSHSSAETTKGHYLAAIVEATAIRMLPRLW